MQFIGKEILNSFTETNNQTKLKQWERTGLDVNHTLRRTKKNLQLLRWLQPQTAVRVTEPILEFVLTIFQTQSGLKFLLSDSKKIAKGLRTLYLKTLNLINQLLLF